MKKIAKILILACVMAIALPKTYAQVDVGVSASIAPPELPVYTQPECPADGDLWQPGYWAYDPSDGYYWVPGVWVAPPQVGVLWTPPYWGFEGGLYGFHAGFWGPTVGFYGGINYGFGYGGIGFFGGRWDGGRFRYNTAAWRVNRAFIHNTYVDRSWARNRGFNRASFNGRGGIDRRPNAREEAAMREHHINATANQIAHQEAARKDRNQFAKENHGRPGAAAMDKVGGRAFNERGRVAANRTRANVAADRTHAKVAADRSRDKVAADRSRDKVAADRSRAKVATERTRAKVATDRTRAKAATNRERTNVAQKREANVTRRAAQQQRAQANREARQQRVQQRPAQPQRAAQRTPQQRPAQQRPRQNPPGERKPRQ